MRGYALNVHENRKRNTEQEKDPADHAGEESRSRRERNPSASGSVNGNLIISRLKLPHLFTIAISIAIIDQMTKSVVVSRLYPHESIPLLPGIFSITRIHNSGIAFGLFPGLPDLFMGVTLMSMFIVLYFYLTVKPRGVLLTLGCALILGGAAGNLIDRFRLGYVVDFVHFSFWPAFNVADSSVSIGVGLLLIFFYLQKEGTPEDASDSV